MNKIIIAVVALCLLAVLFTVLWLVNPAPAQFQLLVINNSSLPVDRVHLFGSGIEGESLDVEGRSTLVNLAAGNRGILEVLIADKGELRFKVQRGLNKIDSIIAKDVAALAGSSKTLTIHLGNRFIISDGITEPD